MLRPITVDDVRAVRKERECGLHDAHRILKKSRLIDALDGATLEDMRVIVRELIEMTIPI